MVLPPTGDPENYIDVSVWDDSEDNYDTFAAALYRNKRSKKRVITTAVLVHHAHNDYNSNAISVSTPAAAGGSIADRHLGYLRDRTLNRIGPTNLPDLIKYAGGEVEVSIVLAGRDEFMIDLPDGFIVGDAIRDFLAQFGITASGAPRWGHAPRERHTHAGSAPDTVRTLAMISGHPRDPEPVTGLNVTTWRIGDPEARTLGLSDTATGRTIGSWTNGRLILEDERDREAVLPLLDAEGIPVDRPVTDPTVPEDGTWPRGKVPNAWVRQRSGGLDMRARNPRDPNSQETFAIYNPTLEVLWVEDSHLVAPALRYLHRMGINPAEVGVPHRPWALENEISYKALRDSNLYRQNRANEPGTPNVITSLRPLVPHGVLTRDVVTWLPDDQAPDLPDLGPTFHMLERYVTARTTLFPEHTLTGTATACRLCGNPAAAFTTPIAATEVAYCHPCLSNAAEGLVTDLTRAGAALKDLSRLEFDGQPMLETQLDSLHLNPATPAEPATIDRLLLLRFGVCRKRLAWTLLLEAAGFAEDGLRTGRGTLIRSRDGHLCLSMREKAVCDFLHQHGIEHEREPLYPPDPDYNLSGLRRADWILADGTLVELWGLPKDPEYAAKMEAKRLLAARHNLRLVELFDTDLPNLPTIFGPWFPSGTKSAWTWSPLLVATAESTAAKEAKPFRGDDRGRNDFNTASRQERVQRCAEAIRLQDEGLSRPEVGRRMSAGAEAVKRMLRDGKFYADISTDPVRYELAKRAADARKNRTTKAEFQAQFGLSAQKANEVWRDAGVLFTD